MRFAGANQFANRLVLLVCCMYIKRHEHHKSKINLSHPDLQGRLKEDKRQIPP